MYLAPENHFPSVTIAPVRPDVAVLYEKGSSSVNEDLVLTGDTTFAVFDGSTSLVPQLLGKGRTGGRMAAQISRDIFADESLALADAAGIANRRIRRQAVLNGVDYRRKEEMWSTSLAAVRLSAEFIEWCRIGDCQILIVHEDGSCRLIGQTPSHDAPTLARWKVRAKNNPGAVMQVMAAEIADVRSRMNIDYGVLNGEAEALGFLQSGRLPLAGIKTILLYSDGLMLPQQDPHAGQDIGLFHALYAEGGLARLREHVRALQLGDIDCRLYPRFKTHDDIAAVAVTL